ncbi:chain-length determining protein [Catenovulum sp. SM1970]|uniref:GumC family protein n=1 Tax=Marinifaba aquimaris TaxID=2741323 RepID=UPI001574E887|nr:chain-length determining protein [Marinifaba aquimaris]NTS76159.1 chain-length determining protein [Marinifaba aquimaris]
MKSLAYQLHYLLAGAWRQRYVIIIPMILLPLIGGLVSFTSAKQYQAHTSMLIQETAKMNPFLEDLAVSTMLKDRIAALTTLLHSRHILQSVAMERGLITDKTPDAERDSVVAQLSDQLSMNMAGKDLINISLKSGNPDGMKETLTSVSRHFVEQLLAPERSSIRDSAYFLEEHIQHRRQDLEKAENALAEFRNANAFALPEMHATNLTRLTQLKQQLSERQAELAGKNSSLGGISQLLSTTNPIIGRIEEQIIRIRGELALLNTRYTEKHSKVIAAERKLRRLETERQAILKSTQENINTQQLWDIASNVQVDGDKNQPLLISQLESLQTTRNRVQSLEEEVKWLEKTIADLEPKVAAYGQHEHQLKKLERDLSVKSNMYEDLLERYEMAQVTGSLSKFEEKKRIKVIDRPFTPTAPSNLPWFLFIIAGLFGGLFLGVGFAVMFEVTDTSIRRIDKLQQISQLPVLSRLPSQSEFAS